MLKSEVVDIVLNIDREDVQYRRLNRSRSGTQIGRGARPYRSQQVGIVAHSSTTAGYTNGMGRTQLSRGSALVRRRILPTARILDFVVD